MLMGGNRIWPFGSERGNPIDVGGIFRGGDDDPDVNEPLDEGGLSIELLFSLRWLIEISGLDAGLGKGKRPFCPEPGFIML